MISEDKLSQRYKDLVPPGIPEGILINGIDPFYLVRAAYSFFDHSGLPDNQRLFPMYRFQETMLVMAALYRFNIVQAPSQGGKTSGVEILAATDAFSRERARILILSTIDTQARRVLDNIRDNLVQRFRLERYRGLRVDNDTTLELRHNGSTIRALPHSLKALTGNPADLVILDEIAKWDREPHVLYAEALARTGATQGRVFAISALLGEGQADPKEQTGFRGSFFHYQLLKTLAKRKDPHKNSAGARMTYHVSPKLCRNIDVIRSEMDSALFEEHYLGIPRKAVGVPVFGADFSRKEHVKTDIELTNLLSLDEPLFMCYDPGLTKAVVLGQLDLAGPRLIYLRAEVGRREETFGDFVRRTWMKYSAEFRSYGFLLFSDVAGRKENDQTLVSNVEVIAAHTGQYPITQYQQIEPGIQTMRSFMRRRGEFFISEKCAILIEAFETGLVHDERAGVRVEKWKKDGYYEHPGDASRYPVQYLTGGLPAETLAVTGYAEVTQNHYADPYTGY